MLSNTSKYAIRAVIYLALNGNKDSKIGIKQISKDLSIPTPFLGKILQSLAKHKLLASTKGPHGGFSLGKSASDISLMDIVEIIDGLDSFNMCVLGLESCTTSESNCPIHSNYASIREQLKNLFQTENIGILVEKIKSSEKQLII
ncbi:MAG: Rrf2 family transcriptional regulator [Bacteroidales bacterium]|nr:Rrf2 family transcriptional regulator [Bacteroidales bacterium]